MSCVPTCFNNGLMTLLLKGTAYQVAVHHHNYEQIKDALREGGSEDEVLDLVTEEVVVQSLEQASDGKVTLENDRVLYRGEEVHSVEARRILEFQSQGLPFEPTMCYLENSMQNPSYKSRQEGYQFSQDKNLPITEDGYLLAYKAITEDWKDKYSGKIDNRIGAIVSMDRALVDDNHDNHCSKGLHVGAMDYVSSYAYGTDRIVIVKVHPKDIVSVPTDCSFHKMRVCSYQVIGEYQGDLVRPLYKDSGEPYDYNDNDDWEDEDFIDDYYDDGDVESDYDDDYEEQVEPPRTPFWNFWKK
jgi:hypothetical protein